MKGNDEEGKVRRKSISAGGADLVLKCFFAVKKEKFRGTLQLILSIDGMMEIEGKVW